MASDPVHVPLYRPIGGDDDILCAFCLRTWPCPFACRICDGSRRVWLPNPDDLDLMVPAAQAHPLADNVLPCPACGPNVKVAEVSDGA